MILSEYLNEYLNIGVFFGITGASVELVMRLDLAIQMLSILSLSKDQQNNDAFDEYAKSNLEKKGIVKSLINWLFMNYAGQKGKQSPTGSRSQNLCVKLENLLYRLSESEAAVSECLPVLMKSVLITDNKLRELVRKNEINMERAI